MPVKTIDSREAFHRAILLTDRPVVIDFWAPWCSPCREISPALEELAELAPNVDFYKVNMDDHEPIARECYIAAIPSYLYFKKGYKEGEVRVPDLDAVVALVSKAAGQELKLPKKQ